MQTAQVNSRLLKLNLFKKIKVRICVKQKENYLLINRNMSLIKYLVGCATLVLIFNYIEAAGIPKTDKQKDDNFQTYVIEPSSDFEQQDVSTIIPPLVEGEPSPVSIFHFIYKKTKRMNYLKG